MNRSEHRGIFAGLLVFILLLRTAQAGEAPSSRPSTRPAPITSLIFSRDGSQLIAARHDAIMVLSAEDGAVQRALKPDIRRISALALDKEDRLMAVGGGTPGESGSVLVIGRTSGRVLASSGGFDDLVTSVSFSPAGLKLAAASADRSARLFEIRGNDNRLEEVAQLEGHAGPVLSVIFSADAKTIVTASADRSVKVWNAENGKLLRTLSNHTAVVRALAARPGGVAGNDNPLFPCASGGDDQTVRVWQPESGRMVRIVRNHDGPVLALAYAPDGSALFSGGAEGVVRMIDSDSDQIERRWAASDDWIYALAVSPDGNRLASGDWAGVVKCWQLAPDQVRFLWQVGGKR